MSKQTMQAGQPQKANQQENKVQTGQPQEGISQMENLQIEQQAVDWLSLLIKQAQMHPAMEPQDVYKIMFQAVFGAEHLLADQQAAYRYFIREYDVVQPQEMYLYEPIQENVCRINFGAWKQEGLPGEWLFRMFADSVSTGIIPEKEPSTRYEQFTQYEKAAEAAVKSGIFSFSEKEWKDYRQSYYAKSSDGCTPYAVHHSEHYRSVEQPAYRLVSTAYLRCMPVLKKLTELKAVADRENRMLVVAIDGRCASGKTTVAEQLSRITGAGIVHMDDFFLPANLRTDKRLAEPGGNVHYERFYEEVLPRLGDRSEFGYHRFDCSKMQLGENVIVPAGTKDGFVRVVEGAYSLHPYFGEYADIRVFSQVEKEEQLRRIANRDGEAVLFTFREKWIPMEETYFKAFSIRESADMVI